MDYAPLARLRPLMPMQVLAEIVGPAWTPPTDDPAGRVFLPGLTGFAAQVDEAGRFGRVSFYRDFPSDLVVEGLHTGMALDAVRQLYPRTVVSAEQGSPGIEGFETDLPNGNALHMRFKDNRLLGFDLLWPGAVYPKPNTQQAWPRHAKAYDLAMLPHRADRKAAGKHGWCHGWTPRAHDPNAGLAPPAGWDESTPAGYQSIWSRDSSGQVELQSWAQGQAPNHIGGTMQPVQAHPEPGFSPFYVEFEEAMGGFNFGGGTAQLDLDQMRLDWACG